MAGRIFYRDNAEFSLHAAYQFGYVNFQGPGDSEQRIQRNGLSSVFQQGNENHGQAGLLVLNLGLLPSLATNNLVITSIARTADCTTLKWLSNTGEW